LGKIGKACLGITSGVMGLGITGINDTGMFCLDVDEHVFEGDAVANGVIVQVLNLDERTSVGDTADDGRYSSETGHVLSILKDCALSTNLSRISTDTQRVVSMRGIGGGGGGFARYTLLFCRSFVLVVIWLLGDLDHGHLKLAVLREEREVVVRNGDSNIRRAVCAEPAKGSLDLVAANPKVPVGVVHSAADLHGELHDFHIGSKAGEHIGDIRNI
jgi:hypothetical protein